jgi:outer membrane protein OmpA-like peptidoglycan-associated protein
MKLNTKLVAKVCSLLPIGIMALTSFSQTENLVNNGSFESLTSKPKKLGQIELASDWTSPTGVRADLFTPTSKVPAISTPTNFYGSEEAFEGSNYAGILAYSYNDKMPRSYIMTKLSTPLKKGARYCVSFNLALAELSKYSSNDIGVNLSKKAFGTDEKSSIIDEAHVLHQDNKIFNAMYGWDKVCGVFIAKGGEKFLTIGNFNTNDKTENEKNRKPADIKGTPIIAAYYYIDDVSVFMLEDGQSCDCISDEAIENMTSTIYQKTVILKDNMTAKQKIEVQSAYFGFGQAMLQPQGKTALDLIAEEMKKNPGFKLEVKGHSNSEEISLADEKEKFADMDKKRAEVVVAYLIEAGVQEHRIITSGQGDSEPSEEVSEGDDEDLILAKNRRVSFVVRQQ